MAAKRPLKVYRTSIGFADAYIAAPSQKAALAAWGAERNLFDLGMAELVTEPALARAALDNPGEIVRVPKGTTADHLAAIPEPETAPAKRIAGAKRVEGESGKPVTAKPVKARPRPGRQKLDDARAALEERRDQQASTLRELDARIAALRAERVRLQKDADAELARLQAQVDRQDKVYRQALGRWKG